MNRDDFVTETRIGRVLDDGRNGLHDRATSVLISAETAPRVPRGVYIVLGVCCTRPRVDSTDHTSETSFDDPFLNSANPECVEISESR